MAAERRQTSSHPGVGERCGLAASGLVLAGGVEPRIDIFRADGGPVERPQDGLLHAPGVWFSGSGASSGWLAGRGAPLRRWSGRTQARLVDRSHHKPDRGRRFGYCMGAGRERQRAASVMRLAALGCWGRALLAGSPRVIVGVRPLSVQGVFGKMSSGAWGLMKQRLRREDSQPAHASAKRRKPANRNGLQPARRLSAALPTRPMSDPGRVTRRVLGVSRWERPRRAGRDRQTRKGSDHDEQNEDHRGTGARLHARGRTRGPCCGTARLRGSDCGRDRTGARRGSCTGAATARSSSGRWVRSTR